MATITFTVPLPNKCLQPNARAHSARKAAATKRSRGDAGIAALAAGSKDFTWKEPELLATYYFRTRHAHDNDNLTAWLKSTIDGVADALRINDRNITVLPPVEKVDKANPRLVITVSEP